MSGKTLKTQKISTIEDLDKTAGYEKMPKMKKSELVETVGIYREACTTTLKALRNKELDLSNFQVEVVRLNQSLKTQKKTSDEKYEKLERMYNDLFEEHQNAQEFMRLHGIHFVSSLSEKNLASNGSEQDGSSNGGSTSGEEQEDLEKTDKNDSPSSVVIPQNEGSENGEKDNSLSGKTDGGTEDDAVKAKNNAKDGAVKAEESTKDGAVKAEDSTKDGAVKAEDGNDQNTPAVEIPRSRKGKATKRNIPKTKRLENSAIVEEIIEIGLTESFFEEHPNYAPVPTKGPRKMEWVEGYIKMVTYRNTKAEKKSYRNKDRTAAPSSTKESGLSGHSEQKPEDPKDKNNKTECGGTDTEQNPQNTNFHDYAKEDQSVRSSDGSSSGRNSSEKPEKEECPEQKPETNKVGEIIGQEDQNKNISEEYQEFGEADTGERIDFDNFDKDDEVEVGTIISANPGFKEVFLGSLLSVSLMAYLICMKFTMFLPFHRISANWQKQGIYISKQLMGQWLEKTAALLRPVYMIMLQDLRGLEHLQADETTALCLEALQKCGRKKCYFIQFLSGPRESTQIQLYSFRQNRNQVFVTDILDVNVKYCLQSDAFPGYLGWDFILNFGCFDHARRPFAQALQAWSEFGKYKKILREKGINSPEMKELLDKPGNRLYKHAVTILDTFGVIYHNEAIWKKEHYSAEQLSEARKEYSQPLLDRIYEIVNRYTTKCDEKRKPVGGEFYVNGKSKFGRGVTYLKNNKESFYNLMDEGNFEISNIRCERGMKPIKLLENNSLFYDSVRGAELAAEMFTYIQTCRLNKVLERRWLTRTMKEMAKLDIPAGTEYEELDDKTIEKIRSLTPYSKSLPKYMKSPE